MAILAGGYGETLVLVHGFGGDKNNWVRISPHLVDHYTLPSFLDELGIERFYLGGESSMGSGSGT